MVEAQNPQRCPQCLMLLRLCICSLMPRVANRVRLVLMVHHREIRKPTNTGGLAARCLASHAIHVIGRLGEPVDYDRIAAPSATNLFLFPSEGATPLSTAFAQTLSGPVQLIVPDGNWGQAGRVRRKLDHGAPIVDVTLPPGPLTEYRLRREARDRPDGLATLEAIARALEVLEGPEVSAPLLEIFRIFVERTLWSKGKLPASAVYGGVPPS